MADVLTMLCVATEEQQTIHGHLESLIRAVSNGKAEIRFIRPPHVDAGASMYGISPHRVPSDVHPVPCKIVLRALQEIQAPLVLLMDGSVYLDDRDIHHLVESALDLEAREGLALPVRYNYCPSGPLRVVARDGEPRFEYGILPRDFLRRGLEQGARIYTGDVLLSEWAAHWGIGLRVAEFMLNRFPERILLIEGKASRKVEGLACPDIFSSRDDYHRCFPGRSMDCADISAFRAVMREGEIALMTYSLDTKVCARLDKALGRLRPDLAAALQENPIRSLLPELMAAIEPYMDVFESRLDLLDCLIILKNEEIRETIHLGDREFWSAFSRYTVNDAPLLAKLLNLKV
jgi:hypothetical protein